MGGHPWFLVDVRDIAMAEIMLAESKTVESGSRFLLTSGDVMQPGDFGSRIMDLYPSWDCATTMVPPLGAKEVATMNTRWYRVHPDSRKATRQTGMFFRSFDDTLKAMVDSLVSVGGIKPRLKQH